MKDHQIFKFFKNEIVDLSNKKIIIFGTGNTASLYLNSFIRENLDIYAFCDNNKDKHNTLFFNKKVISFEELKNIDNSYVLICSGNIKNTYEIEKQLKDNNIDYSLIDHYLFMKHKSDIEKVLDILDDDASRKIYLDIIYARMNNKEISDELYNNNDYFCLREFIENNKNQVFVDLGAYVGDTIEKYLFAHEGVFKKIYAFEPDKNNYKALKYRIERLKNEWGINDNKIKLIQGSVGKENRIVNYDTLTENSSLGTIIKTNSEGINKSKMYKIDSYFKNDFISFIKADIESYEYDMLLGASEIIKRDNPLLSICIYHSASDMYDIPLLVHNINNKNKVRIRHHSYSYIGTTLYANNK